MGYCCGLYLNVPTKSHAGRRGWQAFLRCLNLEFVLGSLSSARIKGVSTTYTQGQVVCMKYEEGKEDCS